jgi:hypothetical protein
MSQRRNQAGMFPGAFGGFSRIGEQEMYDPTWANIDFADFKGLDMDLISRNAEYTQNIANKRYEEMMKAQEKLLEEVKLGKRFGYLEDELRNKTSAIIENAGNVQLSDNANFTKLNSGLISLKHDPSLKQALYSTEQAKKAKEIFDKDPTIESRPWDAPMYNKYKAFLEGKTNDFELSPVYKNVDLYSVWDGFFKGLDKKEQDTLTKYGTYGLMQAKTEGRDVGQLIEKIQRFKDNEIKNNPEIRSHLKRRADYLFRTSGIPEEQSTEDYLNETIMAAATKNENVNNTIESVEMDPNASGRFQARQATNSSSSSSSNSNSGSGSGSGPYSLIGTALMQGNKAAPAPLQQELKTTLNAEAIRRLLAKNTKSLKEGDITEVHPAYVDNNGNYVVKVDYTKYDPVSEKDVTRSTKANIEPSFVNNILQTFNNHSNTNNTSTTNTSQETGGWQQFNVQK